MAILTTIYGIYNLNKLSVDEMSWPIDELTVDETTLGELTCSSIKSQQCLKSEPQCLSRDRDASLALIHLYCMEARKRRSSSSWCCDGADQVDTVFSIPVSRWHWSSGYRVSLMNKSSHEGCCRAQRKHFLLLTQRPWLDSRHSLKFISMLLRFIDSAG